MACTAARRGESESPQRWRYMSRVMVVPFPAAAETITTTAQFRDPGRHASYDLLLLSLFSRYIDRRREGYT